MTPSSRNLQPLKYILINEPSVNAGVFTCLGWAKDLKGWNGPAPAEQPSAYIIILGDREITGSYSVDPGIVAQTMILGARTHGFGGCMLASIKHDLLRETLSIEARFDILYVIALGEPSEIVTLETASENGDTSYWRDEAGVHRVPKRTCDELILRKMLK